MIVAGSQSEPCRVPVALKDYAGGVPSRMLTWRWFRFSAYWQRFEAALGELERSTDEVAAGCFASISPAPLTSSNAAVSVCINHC